jgi:hypothetical protein
MTARLVLILAALAFFNTGCDLIVDIIRALGRYCETPEFVVNRADDPARGGLCTSEGCSLRQAVQVSNDCPGTQTIRVPAGTYLLTLAGADEDLNRTGDLDVTDSVIINGEDGAIIDGGALDRVLDILAPAHAALTSIEITNGNGIEAGGIRNAGELTMTGGAFRDNAARRGGGLLNLGTAALEAVEVRDNLVDRGDGGGIYNEGDLTITGGSLSANTAPRGAGLFNGGTAVLEAVSFESNAAADDGGGIFNQAGLTVTGGIVSGNEAARGGGIHNIGDMQMNGGSVQANRADLSGGGLHNAEGASLLLSGVIIAQNRLGSAVDPLGLPTTSGAGLFNAGQAELLACLVQANEAVGGLGGGIANEGGTLRLRTTTVESNRAIQGGGLQNGAMAILDESIINDNVAAGFDFLAGIGGGINNRYMAALALTNSTISQNTGGGIFNEGSAQLSSVTITGNTDYGLYSYLPGIEGEPEGPPAAKIRNTLIAGNPGVDCDVTTLISEGHNLDGDRSCGLTGPGDLPGRMAGLGPLAANGGPTRTHALLEGSPAIDAAESCPPTDQRGFPRPRPAGGACDIGAYEYDPTNTGQSGSAATPVPSATPEASPAFTFTQQANCRKGPGTAYESLGIGQVGEQAPIQGLSNPLGWYYVELGNGARCFVAGSTGDVSGSLDGLPVIPAPPLPVAPPAPALNVSTKVCDSSEYVVRLSWKDVEGESGYRVYRDGSLIATLGANATVYDDAAPDYESHDYRVEAFNAAGAASSAALKSEGCLY